MTVQAVILAALLGFHYRHVLYSLVYYWQNNGDWSHGFVIPLFSLYYLYARRDRLPVQFPDRRATTRMAGALLIALAFVVYTGSTIYQIEYPKRLSLVISVMGVVLMTCGWPVARWCWFAVAFLVFALPLPERLYFQLTMPLRVVAAQVSGAVLQAIFPNMIFEVQAVVVHYWDGARHGQLDVEQACSGIRLLIAMMALGVATAFVSDRPVWQRMVIILACMPIAIFCNFIRVTLTGLLHVKGHSDLATGFWHTLLGLGMLGIAFGIYLGISYVLSHLFVEGES
ncbi:MAG TPA: exosortase/archaeosortase family protein [Phycisphaerae bacterium]|jgi:exosortase|nr:exosortase/archaeosortase family protein [Phycisphaerae bacterium]HOB75703.1 exosortase/archaeosortase family protein [Phycisphaerae bacterium]HOJ56471.1 exosortase/archaeosortase family protein [Phycisphaerae bacterium]HOL27744.1 exosortase/archaeosortase family protein [Phycisphaerae bacterium]HPP22670.1 exosortase/archaeosortase family protein [Phycisphaerae bacterium]